MSSYCLKCRKNTESKNLKVVKTENGRIMLLSKSIQISKNIQCVIVKNRNLLKSKKLEDY